MNTAPTTKTREIIGAEIAQNILSKKQEILAYWNNSGPVKHFYVDDLLPAKEVEEIHQHFPSKENLMKRNTLREKKQVGVELEKYHPTVTEHLMAFQEPAVVDAIYQITGIKNMVPDPSLYASGLSRMQFHDFLNPHLDNSSDGNADKYRVINLLFYITPNWKIENGGNLELWDEKVKTQKTILSAFNRLVIMATDDKSWHSVSKVLVDDARCCLSNYYFAPQPVGDKSYFHATTFKGRPGETVRGFLLNLDGMLRNGLRKVFRKGIFSSKHRRDR